MNSAASRVYARAFLQASDGENITRQLLPQLTALGQALSAPENIRLLADPRLGPKPRAALAKQVGMALKAPMPVKHLLKLLAENRRLGEAGAVLLEAVRLAHARDGIADAQVETAVPLTPEQSVALKQVLAKALGAREVLVEETVVKNLMGGFRAFAGGRVWDCSLRGRLNALAARFAQAIEK